MNKQLKIVKSSYDPKDVTMLVKDLTGLVNPVTVAEKDEMVKNGAFERAIMIKEYPMNQEYEDYITSRFDMYIPSTAVAVASVAEQIYKAKGNDLVLVSIVRAGIPIGILIKRYLEHTYHVEIPHYAISLVKGLDNNAMKYILSKHKAEGIQFIDGWTGKGTVTNELVDSAKNYPGVDASLAVLSDVTGLAKYAGIREDFAVPSAPMNACATGLVSITVFNNDVVGPDDFHGAMYLEDLESHDHSRDFVDMVTEYMFSHNLTIIPETHPAVYLECPEVAKDIGVDMKKLNPGINEAARAILRRDLKELLVRRADDWDVQVIVSLARMKGVAIREYPLKTYKAISVAK